MCSTFLSGGPPVLRRWALQKREMGLGPQASKPPESPERIVQRNGAGQDECRRLFETTSGHWRTDVTFEHTNVQYTGTARRL